MRFDQVVPFTCLALAALAACNSSRPSRPTAEATAPVPVSAPAASTVGAPAAGQPFDAQFIDAMVPHHEKAIVMAREALEKAQHAELREMASAIIDAQQREIDQLGQWRGNWYPGLPPTGGLPMPMTAMAGHADGTAPEGAAYDDRFIEMMIPHHQDAIEMSTQALTRAEHEELRSMARSIIEAQQGEIDRMTAWRTSWSRH